MKNRSFMQEIIKETNNHKRNKSTLFAMFLGVYLIPGTALGLTANDVLQKMGDRESAAYIIASVEMAAFLAKVNGDKERSACIMNWWFDTPATKRKVIAVFERFSDRAPQPILYVLMNKACGDPKSAAK